ncbi:YaaR family protein [Bacillus andreraoultii]|uniref:YaaR family protein n=1 Tax=Bacillus andreraoultii TaxID=1499685 RepID=UPI000539738A|nr:YaaR family protein [Bacillus andreraoultii]
MKVNQNLRISRDSIQQDTRIHGQGVTNFQELVKSQNEKLQLGNIHALFTEIEKAGERLSRSRNFRDLAKYKTLIQHLMKEAVDTGIGLKKSHTWDSEGQSRVLQIIEKVDAKLVELTDEILNQESDRIKILGLIGEIKGLIINLYG